ncbi:Glycosyltransferase involved in cell wall bisynthesis [Thiothrix eikelboomii]|uniref:Glycosyltransferase involved in cell wall bisynthesis n=1 Tax=Thiothrix eikelboomii TaxID=92487 RepID=A0A1T4XIN7_9GAMM|nr:glycosyltransferase [Thiothrix eikelboomii]SKA89420.1 Glycosyltransferase involved in cell wall bisynthesis [Thiothrix eikelboomii]
MKIGFVIPFLSKGGAECVVVDLANSMVQLGQDVTIFLLYSGEVNSRINSLSTKVKIHYIYPKKHSTVGTYARVITWFIRNKNLLSTFDIIHTNLTFGSIFSSTAWLYKTMLSPPSFPLVIETNHSVGTYIKKWQHALFLLNSHMRDGYILMAQDDQWDRHFSKKKKYPLIELIPNGIDLSKLHVSPQELDLCAASIGRAKEAYIIGSIGRMVRERNPDAIVDVFFELLSRKIDSDQFDIHFYMGGTGPEFNRIAQKFSDMGISNFVTLPGLVENSRVTMSSFSLYVTMNVKGTTGISGLEATSQGIPTVAVQMTPGYTAKETDWIWSSESPKLVAEKILELLRDQTSLSQLAKVQKDFCIENFSATTMAKRYLDFYKKCQLSLSNTV